MSTGSVTDAQGYKIDLESQQWRLRRASQVFTVLLTGWILLIGGRELSAKPEATTDPGRTSVNLPYTTRPYRLGFIRWPFAGNLFIQGAPTVYEFIRTHADLICHHLESGVPWSEALADAPFSQELIADWHMGRSNTPKGHKVYVAITPLDMSRRRLASYWGSAPNMPLPAPWDTYPLNHPNVKIAYLNYAERVIRYYQPKYLAIGIEVNLALLQDRQAWEQYLDLHQYVYTALKQTHPKLQVFASLQYDLIRLWSQRTSNREAQARELDKLLPYCDLLGLSFYPYGPGFLTELQKPVPEDYFDAALAFGKPIAVAETGYPSHEFSQGSHYYTFSPADQSQYADFLLRKGNDHHFLFIVNATASDFEQYLAPLPADFRTFMVRWAYNGFLDGDGHDKPALDVWDAYLALPQR